MMWRKHLFILLLLCGSILCEDDDAEVEDMVDEIKEEIPIEEIPYSTPVPVGNYYIAEHFDDRQEFEKRWIPSEAKKEGAEEDVSKYDGKWDIEEAERAGLSGDLGLVLKSKAHHHAISTRLEKPFFFDNKRLVIQYEVRFQNGQECGGAYMKLLTHSPTMDLRTFHDKTPYTIMFGPDKCGTDNKLHFIFRHRNPKTGAYEEKHWKKSNTIPKLDDAFKDKKPHLFALALFPDNKFEIMFDRKRVASGNLLEDFSPSVNPPAEIDDPNDFKPTDWDEREKIPDPTATKPDDWDEDAPRQIVDPKAKKPAGWLDDEPELIPDPEAKKPHDWDDEMDGEWEPPLITNPKCERIGCGEWKAPMIDNPNYKGKWRASLINNPNYKGKWAPRKISNPDFFEDWYPCKMTPIGAVGFELWSMVDGIMFDNIIITDDFFVADHWADSTFALKRELADQETDNTLVRLFKYTNKHPWLWAVYLVVICLPVVLFISFCCTSPTPSKARKESEAALKAKLRKARLAEEKANEVKKGVIDEVKEEEEEEEDEEEENPAEKETQPADTEAAQDGEDEEEEEGEVDEEGTEEQLEENVEVIDKEENAELDSSGDYPRKRRPRKE